MKTAKLKNGAEIPVIGLGTYKVSEKEVIDSVLYAFEAGYRHIDTADRYKNHKEIAKAVKKSGIARNEFFLTTKVWIDDLQGERVISSANRFLEEMETDYIDLLLIHYPNRDIPVSETLAAMEKLKQDKIIKTYGVSNFTIHHLQDCLDAGYHPEVNQVEFHPSLNQKELKKFCDEKEIVITSYSPLAQGQDLTLPTIQKIAEKRKVSEAQVVLNWLIQKKMAVIPKSTDPVHIKNNFACLEWELTDEEIKQIDLIGGENRIINPSYAHFDY